MFALKSLFVGLLTLVGFAAAAHTSMTVTYFKSNSNCTQPTGVKTTVQMYVCLGTSEYKDGSSTAVYQYMYEDYGMCTVPCTDGNNINCQWGLYYPYHLDVCNSGKCSKDQYGVLTCGDAFIPTAV
uniref:Secreted protein n=1 Tax=Spumella elongata TaxID=89044 RepID=A0A7S3HRW1_9STRA